MPGWLHEAGRVTYGTFLAKGNVADFSKPCMMDDVQGDLFPKPHEAEGAQRLYWAIMILTARKDERSVSERMRSCCNGFAEFSGCLQARRTGVAPRCNLTRESQ
mgnify:CR=1 FL=1